MKKLTCSICGEIYEVDDDVLEVKCGDCLLAGEPPVSRENGIWYYRQEVYDRILGEYKPDFEIWENAQKLRNEGVSLREIGRRLAVSHVAIWKHTVNLDKLPYEGSKKLTKKPVINQHLRVEKVGV